MSFTLPYRDNEGDFEPDSFEDRTTKNLRAIERRLNTQTTRIVHGLVTAAGAPAIGGGYSVTKQGSGVYDVTFDVQFASAPSVVAGAVDSGTVVHAGVPTASGFTVTVLDLAGVGSDANFSFIAAL